MKPMMKLGKGLAKSAMLGGVKGGVAGGVAGGLGKRARNGLNKIAERMLFNVRPGK